MLSVESINQEDRFTVKDMTILYDVIIGMVPFHSNS